MSLSPHDGDLKQLETKIRAAGGIAKYELPPRNEPATAPISFSAVRALDSARDALENLESAAARDAARALTSFHDAAAKGDEDRYFDLFPEDAVFLGTDGSERWEQPAFKKFALPYFQKESAWIYIPLVQRFSVVEKGKVLAFDELLGHRKLGLCRGSGVLVKRNGGWKILQYNLSVPIPNGIMGDVAKTIRRSELGPAAGATTTTIFLVRHAEKITEPKSRDPLLTELGNKRAANLAKLLKHEKLSAAYASEYQRTQLTVKPAADRFGIPVTVFTARDPRGLAKKIKESHAGQTLLIAGHSNTVPAIARALGIAKPPRLKESDYGDVFVIRLTPAGASMLRLAVTTEP